MADKSTQLVLAALSRAAADPAGVPLHGSKTQPGLFAGTALGKQAAQRCKDEGYLTVLRTEARGRGDQEICSISDRGLAYLLGQTSPRQVLEDFLRVLEARQAQLDGLVSSARQMQAGLDALRTTAERVLHRVTQPHPLGTNGTPPLPRPAADETWTAATLEALARWQQSGASEDFPLPDLYQKLLAVAPGKVIIFRSTERTLEQLAKRGYKIVDTTEVQTGAVKLDLDSPGKWALKIKGSELSRAHGGPHSLVMPLVRDA